MSNNLPRFPGESMSGSVKSFWARPEGKTGMIVLVAALLAGGYFGLPIALTLFTTLNALLGQVYTFAVLAGGLALAAFLVTNRRIRTLVKLGFQGAMRWITGLAIEIDPIGIMRSYIEDLTKKQSIIDSSIENLAGHSRACEEDIKKNQREADNELAKARHARDKGNSALQSISMRQASRLTDMNEQRLKPLHRQMQAHLQMLRKYAEATVIIRTDLENEVNMQERQRKMILASYGAMKAAKDILSGGNDERAMFDQAMEFTAQDYGMKIGAIENFIENTRSFMDSMDIQNGVWEEQALARMAEWDAQVDTLLAGNGKEAQAALAAPETPVIVVNSKVSEYDRVLAGR